jgi:hypothetical protein
VNASPTPVQHDCWHCIRCDHWWVAKSDAPPQQCPVCRRKKWWTTAAKPKVHECDWGIDCGGTPDTCGRTDTKLFDDDGAPRWLCPKHSRDAKSANYYARLEDGYKRLDEAKKRGEIRDFVPEPVGDDLAASPAVQGALKTRAKINVALSHTHEMHPRDNLYTRCGIMDIHAPKISKNPTCPHCQMNRKKHP